MPATIQQQNATSRLLAAAEALRDAVYECAEQKERAALIGLPIEDSPPTNYPMPGDLNHIDQRVKLSRLHSVVDLLGVWLRADNAALNNRKPLDAIVEALR